MNGIRHPEPIPIPHPHPPCHIPHHTQHQTLSDSPVRSEQIDKTAVLGLLAISPSTLGTTYIVRNKLPRCTSRLGRDAHMWTIRHTN
ncbi:hypothetical protein E5D57_010289 [Metarhizium anisopliae]|nr:hypothetical protein E5D57_010289 [Metarhizium anisopliae]